MRLVTPSFVDSTKSMGMIMLVEGIEGISGFGDGFLFQYPFLLVPIWSIRCIHSLQRRLQVKNASLGKSCCPKHLLDGASGVLERLTKS